jgi:hypothetical protein
VAGEYVRYFNEARRTKESSNTFPIGPSPRIEAASSLRVRCSEVSTMITVGLREHLSFRRMDEVARTRMTFS